MKFKYAEPVFAFLLLIVMLFNATFLAVDAFGYNMEKLPEGKFLYSVMSPDGKNTLSLYLVSMKNVNTAIRGEIVSIGEEENIEKRNVYWQVGSKTGKILASTFGNMDTLMAATEHLCLYRKSGYRCIGRQRGKGGSNRSFG